MHTETDQDSATRQSVWPTILADLCSPEVGARAIEEPQILEIWVTSIKAYEIFKISSPLDPRQVTYVRFHGPICRRAGPPVGSPVDRANELGTWPRAKAC